MIKNIVVKGAREHNLKNIDIEIPRDKLIVFTGLSGSGKSSLAFDTIYAEGQRRYVESLSSYARMFLGQMGFLPPYPSTRKQQAKTRVQRLELLPRFMTISACSGRELVCRIAQFAEERLLSRRLTRLLTR